MNQTKPIRIIAVKKPANSTALVKQPVPEYDPNDIDIVVNMVNQAARQQKAEQQTQAQRDRLRVLELREKDVRRRERIVSRKERQYQEANSVVNTIIDAALIGFSILGMATAAWFCWFL